jgi:small redox-active disulfide protein 2
MKIKVLGSGCPTCKKLHKNVQEVVKNMGLKTDVEYSDDLEEMMKLGAMGSPVLAIDGQIKAMGRVPSDKEIEEMILEGEKGDATKTTKKSQGGCSCGGTC